MYLFLFLISSRRHVFFFGGVDHSSPPHLLYPGRNSTCEVPVLAKFTYTPVLCLDHFGFWTNMTPDSTDLSINKNK
jgi:hypothetical protein